MIRGKVSDGGGDDRCVHRTLPAKKPKKNNNIRRQKQNPALILVEEKAAIAARNQKEKTTRFPSLSLNSHSAQILLFLIHPPLILLSPSLAAARQKGVTFRPPDLPALIVHSGIWKKAKRKVEERKISKKLRI
jgi:hypothetical protein